MALPVIALIVGRLHGIKQRFSRLAARIGAGRYVPRRPAATPRARAGPHARQKDPLPQNFAWLVKLMPEASPFGSQLYSLLADPEMAALMQAAPAPMRRPLRSLCRMLGVTPPTILALPPKPRPPPAPPRAKPAKKPRPPPYRPGRLRPFPLSLLPPGAVLPLVFGGPSRRG
jgi:hypothetical protein